MAPVSSMLLTGAAYFITISMDKVDLNALVVIIQETGKWIRINRRN